MKKSFILFFLFFLFNSCSEKAKVKRAVANAPVELSLVRFDQVFFNAKPENLPDLKKKFPVFFPVQIDDAVWVSKMKDPDYRDLYNEVQKKYADFSSQKARFELLFAYMRYYFPKARLPKLVTVIGDMDLETKAIYADSLAIISLEFYLGKDHRFYPFPKYIAQNCEERQMLPDMAESFASSKVRLTGQDFLSKMIYWGKIHYLKQLLLPEAAEKDIIGYTTEQLAWSKENEGYIWRYFINEQMLYSTESKLGQRFIDVAPFSKFYLEIDNQSPGRIGQWMGWKIVTSYMENNEVSIPMLLQIDAKSLFEKSKYKPAKNE